ncbi:L-rhamnose mutarotase [Streptacidiphilus sp. N1-3]|uniref:L-rhamnose mutarotase n=1 Tax=Streptacidiphilus alkalitolerans TaxID=3342712 RepID=A0ABV6X6N7_9ACTN
MDQSTTPSEPQPVPLPLPLPLPLPVPAPAPLPVPHETVGRRTRLRPGTEEEYSHVHRRIPDPVAAALRSAGVVQWRIWRDGLSLFHLIETTHGIAEMGRRMSLLGAVDPDWDELIATLVDPAEETQADLPLVWGMDQQRQFS